MVDLTGVEPAMTTHDTPRLVPLVWLQARKAVYPLVRVGLDGLKLASIFTANFTATIIIPLGLFWLLGVALGAI